MNGEDGLGAIYPAMANSVMMFDALGYPADHPARAMARRSIDKLLVIGADEAYCQPCVSPVWDTALASQALLEVEDGKAHGETRAAALRGLGWLQPLQELEVRGRLERAAAARAPRRLGVPVPQRALSRPRRHRRHRHGDGPCAAWQPAAGPGYDEAIARGVEWIAGLQSGNGGWAAFDADNVDHYLNNIPFADHGALLDPPTADVSARCIGMLAQLGETPSNPVMRRGIDYLQREQMPDGSWFGRWGVNYIYGTWSALCALGAAGLDRTTPSVAKAADWLIAIQNEDGGWGEDCTSYKLDYRGYERAASTASQTAWALLGLMAAGEVDHPAVGRGIAWLSKHQDARRTVAAGCLHRRRLSPRLLPALPRLPGLLPAVGARALSQPASRQQPACRLRHVMILAVTGLQRERRILAGPGVEVVRRRRSMRRPPMPAGKQGVISIGIAGALAPELRPGAWVVADAVHAGDATLPTDRDWTMRLLSRLPAARRGVLLGADTMAATAAVKAGLHRATGAIAVDMESHIAARAARRHGLPFVAARVISDAAHRTLPPAARVGMRADGGIDLPAVLRSLADGAVAIAGADPHRAWRPRRPFAPYSAATGCSGPGFGGPNLGKLPADMV